MKKFLQTLVSFLMLLSGFCMARGAEANLDSSKFLPGLTADFSVNLALPDDFTVEPIEDKLDVEEGLLWGAREAVKTYKQNASVPELPGPVFIVTKSTTVRQSGKDKFTVEDELEQQLKDKGFKDVVIRKTNWSKYPVLHFSGARPNGRVTRMAWVGVHSTDGSTINISYRGRSTVGQGEDAKIWEGFLAGTK